MATCISPYAAVNLNNVQLMLLAIEGAGLCVIAMVWMWMLLQRVAAQRYSMFCVFMVRVHASSVQLMLRNCSNPTAVGQPTRLGGRMLEPVNERELSGHPWAPGTAPGAEEAPAD
jgi:hypothetical protein